jgi:hypothetical protein
MLPSGRVLFGQMDEVVFGKPVPEVLLTANRRAGLLRARPERPQKCGKRAKENEPSLHVVLRVFVGGTLLPLDSEDHRAARGVTLCRGCRRRAW